MSISYKFTKAERLKSKKQIGDLFKNRQSVGAYPLRVFWAEVPPSEDNPPVSIGFNVSKRIFKHAVKRNRYKRLMREAHRLNKHQLFEKLNAENKALNLMLIYVGKEEFDYASIEKKYLKLIDKLWAAVIK